MVRAGLKIAGSSGPMGRASKEKEGLGEAGEATLGSSGQSCEGSEVMLGLSLA